MCVTKIHLQGLCPSSQDENSHAPCSWNVSGDGKLVVIGSKDGLLQVE